MTAPISHQDLSDVIGRIYDCTLDPSLWEPTIASIGELIGAHINQLGLFDLRQTRTLVAADVGTNDALLEVQRRHYATVVTYIERLLDNGLSLDEPLVVSRDIPESRDSKHPDVYTYMQDSWRASGCVDIAQIHLLRTPTRLGYLGMGRHESRGNYRDHDIEILRLLIPHVRRAVTISDVLDAKAIEAERMSDALDALTTGVVLANEDTKIIHANRSAEAMLSAGGPLRDVQGRMRAGRPAASAELKQAVTAAARNEAGIGKTGLAVRLTEDYESPVVAHVLPIANGRVRTRLEPEAVAAVFINSPIDEANCASAVTSAYKLTPAEARVLAPILSGKTVPEAAADLDVAVTTARTHLNNIFAKTGVSRQSDLIRLAAAVATPTG